MRATTFWKNFVRICTPILTLGGAALALYFSIRSGETSNIILCAVGLLLGLFSSDVVHELGHILFAKAANMRVVYAKLFCFRWRLLDKTERFSFASPFTAAETQVIPKSGGDMQKRASGYVLGGLIVSWTFILIVLAAALTLTLVGKTSYLLWGLLPYHFHLFLLNAFPFEYATGKTDALVYKGIKNGEPAEKTMLNAMQIQGELFEGKTYAEIDERLYFDLPQLPEYEPMFVMILDMRYGYYLDKGEYEKAADCLNRIAQAEEYLSKDENAALLGDLTYMHAVNGDSERADVCKRLCDEYLQGETAIAKRILAAYAKMQGDEDAVKAYCDSARKLLKDEAVAGVRRFEERLLNRIEQA